MQVPICMRLQLIATSAFVPVHTAQTVISKLAGSEAWSRYDRPGQDTTHSACLAEDVSRLS